MNVWNSRFVRGKWMLTCQKKNDDMNLSNFSSEFAVRTLRKPVVIIIFLPPKEKLLSNYNINLFDVCVYKLCI